MNIKYLMFSVLMRNHIYNAARTYKTWSRSKVVLFNSDGASMLVFHSIRKSNLYIFVTHQIIKRKCYYFFSFFFFVGKIELSLNVAINRMVFFFIAQLCRTNHCSYVFIIERLWIIPLSILFSVYIILEAFWIY